MVVNHRRKQIVCGAYGMEVARKVQIYVLHGHDLSVTSARRAALDAEHGSQRRLAQRDRHAFAKPLQPVRKTYCRRRLALSRGSGVDCGNKNQLAVLSLCFVQKIVVYLCFVSAVRLDKSVVNPRFFRDFADGQHFYRLRYFYVAFIHNQSSLNLSI